MELNELENGDKIIEFEINEQETKQENEQEQETGFKPVSEDYKKIQEIKNMAGRLKDKIERALKETDLDIEEIAKELGCTTQYVYRIKKKLNILDAGKTEITVEKPQKPKYIDTKPQEETLDFEQIFKDLEKEDLEQKQKQEQVVTIPQQVQVEAFDKQAVKFLINLPFNKLAVITGYEGLKLTKEESETLTNLAKPLLDKYLPSMVQNYGLEFAFISTLALIVLSKYAEYKAWRQKQIEQDELRKKLQEQNKKIKELEQAQEQVKENEQQEKQEQNNNPIVYDKKTVPKPKWALTKI